MASSNILLVCGRSTVHRFCNSGFPSVEGSGLNRLCDALPHFSVGGAFSGFGDIRLLGIEGSATCYLSTEDFLVLVIKIPFQICLDPFIVHVHYSSSFGTSSR